MYCYDLYLSVGPACRPALHLNANDLRNESYPLDWQMNYSLETVLHLFKTGFYDFFDEIQEDVTKTGSGNNRYVVDTKNHIISIHHFSKDMNLNQAKNEVVTKMRKRFLTLDKRLKKSRKIVIISNRIDSEERLWIFLKSFSELYPHLEIKYINMRGDMAMSLDSFEEKTIFLANKLSLVEYRFNDTYVGINGDKYSPLGNKKIWRRILMNYYQTSNLEAANNLRGKTLVVYGAGKGCSDFLEKCDKYRINIKGIAVTDSLNNPERVKGYMVNSIEKYEKEDYIIISLLNKDEAKKTKEILVNKGYCNLAFFTGGRIDFD